MASKPQTQTVSNAVLGTILQGVKDEVGEIKSAMTKMATAMGTLAAVEQRQSDQTSRMNDVFTLLTKHSDRIAGIEVEMPGLKEMRRWVVGGLVAGVSMMLIAVASLVLRPLPAPQLPQIPQIPQMQQQFPPPAQAPQT